MKIQGKVFVLTGGGDGIGRQMALALLRRGASVACIDINTEAMNTTAEMARALGDIPGKLSLHPVDITDKAAVEALVLQLIADHGAVDGLINNAGIIQPFVRLNDLTYEAIERVIQVNLYGTLHMVKAFLPHLLTRPEAHITNISSMGGFLPVPGQTLYGATKAAVKLLTEGLHSELTDTRVKVTIVFPGAIGTNIAANSGLGDSLPGGAGDPKSQAAKKFKMLPADQAARMILDGIEANKYRVLVGPDAKFMDTIYRLNPQRAAAFIYKQMRALLPG